MKTILLFVLATLFLSWSENKTFTIIGQTDIVNNDKEVYLFDGLKNTALDTAIVKGGKFIFQIPIKKKGHIPMYAIDLGAYYYGVIADGSSVKIKMLNGKISTSGTPLNEAYSSYIAFQDSLDSETEKIIGELKRKYGDTNPPSRQEEEGKYFSLREERYKQFEDSLYVVHKNNALGAILFINRSLDKASVEDIELFMKTNEYGDCEFLKKVYEVRKGITLGVGTMFEDFTVRNMENSADVKLSDYVGKGKYVLLDFWASHCGPCIEQVPFLKEVHQKYNNKEFVVLGVNVSDKREKAIDKIQKEGMDWECLYVPKESIAVDKYANSITGIPVIILFAPDGTIMTKDLRGKKMVEYIDKLFKK